MSSGSFREKSRSSKFSVQDEANFKGSSIESITITVAKKGKELKVKELKPKRAEIEPKDIFIHKADTLVESLNCDDSRFQLQALELLGQYVIRYHDERIRLAEETDLLTLIVRLLEESTELDLTVACLKVLATMLNVKYVRERMAEHLQMILDIYKKVADLNVQEWSSCCLSHLCKLKEVCIDVSAYVEEFILRWDSKDPDIQFYTLKVIERLAAEGGTCVESLVNSDSFSLKSLLKIAWSEYPMMQCIALEIVEKLAGIPQLEPLFAQEAIVDTLYSILSEFRWQDLHGKVLRTLKSLTLRPALAREVSFFTPNLLEYVDQIDDDHRIEQALEVILEMSKIPLCRNALYRNEVIARLDIYLRTGTRTMKLDACNCLGQMAKEFMAEKEIRKGELDKVIMELATSPTDPPSLRSVALCSLLNIVRMSPKFTSQFLQESGLEILTYAIRKPDLMPYSSCVTTVHIITALLTEDRFGHPLASRDLVEILVNILQAYPCLQASEEWRRSSELVVASCEALSTGMKWEEWRGWFLELKGVYETSKLFTSSDTSGDIYDAIASLVHNVVSFDNAIALHYIRSGVLHWIMQTKKKESCDVLKAKTTILNNCLFAKFAYTGRLECSDKIPDKGFYITCDPLTAPTVVPVLCDLLATLAVPSKTVYAVTFDENITTRVEIDAYLHQLGKELKKSGKAGPNAERLAKRMRQFYSDVPDDPYLPQFLFALVRQLANDQDLSFRVPGVSRAEWVQIRKVEIIAKFVKDIMTPPPDSETKNNKEAFQFYIGSLKVALGSTVIPLGFLRRGRKLERALLFKVLADRVGVSCALVRGPWASAWVEIVVPPPPASLPNLPSPTHVVDLLDSPGSVYPLNSGDAVKYCGTKTRPQRFAFHYS